MCTRRIPSILPAAAAPPSIVPRTLAGPSCIAPAGDNMRSIEDIQAEVQEIVLKQLT